MKILTIHILTLLATFSNAQTNMLARVQVGNKFGFIDQKGAVVIPLQYENAFDYSEGCAMVFVAPTWRAIDHKGTTLFTLDTMMGCEGTFEDSMMVIRDLSKMKPVDPGKSLTDFYQWYGYVNRKGEIKNTSGFSYAQPFHEGLAAVNTGGHFNIFLIPAGDDLPVVEGGKWGFINTKEEFVIAAQYDGVSAFSEGLAAVKKNGKWGYADKAGNTVIPFQFDTAGFFHDGRALVELQGAAFFIDAHGKKLAAGTPGDVPVFSEGLAVKASGNKWGFINKKGEWVLQPVFDEARPFSCGLAAVKSKGLWGYTTSKGEWAVHPQFHKAWDFRNK